MTNMFFLHFEVLSEFQPECPKLLKVRGSNLLPEDGWARRNARPCTRDLHARGADSPQPNSMVGSGVDPLSKPNIGDETKRPIRLAITTVLGVKEHLHHRHHVTAHLAAVIAPAAPRFFKLARIRIGRLGHAQEARADSVALVNQEIGPDRKSHPFNDELVTLRALAERHAAQPQRVFRSLKKLDCLDAAERFIFGPWPRTGEGRLAR